MKGFAWKDLQSLKIDPMTLVKLQVTFRKIFTHYADELHWTEETCGHGRMTGRPPQQLGVLRRGSFDRIQRRGTNNQHAQKCTIDFCLIERGKLEKAQQQHNIKGSEFPLRSRLAFARESVLDNEGIVRGRFTKTTDTLLCCPC